MAKVGRQASWLRVPPEGDAPEGVQALFDKADEKLGFVPNVLRVYALRPRHLELWNTFYDELMRGESTLTKVQREMIAVVVSVANSCAYCIAAHSAALRKLTKDPPLADQIATDHAQAGISDRMKRALDYALKLTRSPDAMAEDDVQRLRDAGWTDEDVMDIAEVAAMFNFTNRLASGLGWVPNDEFATIGFDESD